MNDAWEVAALLEGGFGIRLEDYKPADLQYVPGDSADLDLILDEQYCLGSDLGGQAGQLRNRLGFGGIGAGQVYSESGTLSGSGAHADLATTLLDDSVDRSQAKAGALASLLGREEWLKDVCLSS